MLSYRNQRIKKYSEEFKTLQAEGKIPKNYKLPKRSVLEGINFTIFPVIALTSLGMLLVLLSYYYRTNMDTLVILGIFGSSFFFPIGIACGWLFMDPFMRAVVLRKLSKKNYGVVFLVAKGRQMITLIKNLDGSLLWHKNNVWHISLKRVFMLKKPIEGGDYEITDRNISLMGGIPSLFLDYSSLRPLTFWKDKTGLEPQELAPPLLGWAQNQKNKAMIFGRKQNIFNIVVLAMLAGILFLTYRCYTILTATGGG